MKKITSIVLMLVASQFNLKAQQRIIHWVHGFGANPSAWFPVVTATREGAPGYVPRNVISNNGTYTGPGAAVDSLKKAGSELAMVVQNFLAPYGGAGSQQARNSFVIAHSQGGLVSRWMADISIPSGIGANSLPHFGGLVTFGTPHLGAQIAESCYNGQLDIFLNNACKDFTGGLISNAMADFEYGKIFQLFNARKRVGALVDELKNSLCDALFSDSLTTEPKTTQFLSLRVLGPALRADGTRSIVEDPILNDYRPQAPALQRLNNAPLQPIVRVNFYGTEDSTQAFIRTTHYIANPSQNIDPFTATNALEDSTILQFARLRTDLTNKAIALEQEAANLRCSDIQWWSLIGFITCRRRENEADGKMFEASSIKKTVTWMDNNNAQWLSIIGGRTQSPTSTRICQCDAGAIPGTDPNRCASVNVRGGCRWVTVTNANARSHETDGVVTKESAIGMPGAIPLTEEQMHMRGSQHMQMRNDPNLKDKLNLLFGGTFGSYFITN